MERAAFIALATLTVGLPLAVASLGGSLTGHRTIPMLEDAGVDAPADTPTTRARSQSYLVEARALFEAADANDPEAHARACRILLQARRAGPSRAADALWDNRCAGN